jgi:hypothetical protein
LNKHVDFGQGLDRIQNCYSLTKTGFLPSWGDPNPLLPIREKRWRGEAPKVTEEKALTCPHCWQRISIVVDCSIREQRFVEDCEVCCKPIEFRTRCRKGRVVRLEADAEGF